MAAKCCPTCGHPIPPDEMLLSLSRIQGRIVGELKKAGRAGLPLRVLVDRVYADDPSGGPDNGEETLRFHISKTNRRLAKFGLKIRAEFATVRRLEKV